ncbi:cnrip1 [Trichonephila clavata]|uniref:CB1 cannabinoid receptor-interacting protein 1 n=1 Tax=Trichonephila clavata TaxID=2740835 RepID=A0A8X6EYC5_TRICU|nr:cnrip1 [Trichonephila clavata]
MSKDKYSLTVNIKRDDDKALVYYKQDGQRFESNCTIKMNVETTYKFLLNFRPSLKIKSGSLKNCALLVKEEEFSPEASSYSLLWISNDVVVSKNKGRDHFTLSLTVQDLGTLEIPLQLKFYDANDKSHSVWGNELHHIEYECIYKRDMFSFNIEKEVFR